MLTPRLKPKLQKSLAFPIGAQVVDGFVGQLATSYPIELWFSEHPTNFKSEFQSILKSRSPYTVVRVMFVRWDKAPNIGDRNERELTGYWTIWIYPVPSAEKSHARALLIDHGLPAVAAWMLRRRDPAWYHGRKRYDVILDVWNRDISLEEIEIAI
jgi:hypothetical protein